MFQNKIKLIIIQLLHSIISLFSVFGCLLPNKYLKYHLLIYPFHAIHWYFNNNKCILIELEKIYNNNKKYLFIQTFINNLIHNLGLKKKSNKELSNFYINLLIISYIITVIRLYIINL